MAKNEFAPGIPADRKIVPLPVISSPVTWEFVLQRHRARRAGEHLDMRLGNPATGHAHSWAMRSWPPAGSGTKAVEQPTHTRQYMDFSGKIGPGYGEGTVSIERREKAEVLSSGPDKLKFNLYRGRDVEELVLRRLGDKDWLFQNITRHRAAGPGSRLPSKKPKYKETSIDKVDHRNPDTILQAKLDGAHVVIDFWREGQPPRVFSYRVSKASATGLINHTPKIKSMMGQFTPKGLQGTILRGEVIAIGPDGKALPSAHTGGMLNANTWTSREMQQEGELVVYAFDVISWRGKDVSSAPFSQKAEMLREATSLAPWLRTPRTASTPAEKKSLLSDIKRNKEPTTNEGVIEWHREKGVPSKAKVTREIDVWVREIFPEKGSREGLAGGFRFSLSKNGPIVGKVGTGMSHELKRDMITNPKKYIGLKARIRVSPDSGSGYAPRNPSFVGWHLDQDLPGEIKMASHGIALARLEKMSADEPFRRRSDWAPRPPADSTESSGSAMKHLKNPGVFIPGIAAAALGANAIYDSVKSMGFKKNMKTVVKAIKGIGYETVDSAQYVKKVDPTIIVVDTVEKAEKIVREELIPLIEEDFGQKIEVSDSEVRQVAEEIFKMTKDNAAALPGVHNGYLIVAPKLPQAILDHEIGHIWDFRKKGLNIKNPGQYQHVFHQLFWKPTYKARVYLAETNAWDLSPESKYKKELEHNALGTYDKAFHLQRRSLAIPVGLLLAGMSVMEYSKRK